MTAYAISCSTCTALGVVAGKMMQNKPLAALQLMRTVRRVQQELLQNNWKGAGVSAATGLLAAAIVIPMEDLISKTLSAETHLGTMISIGARAATFASTLLIAGRMGADLHSNATTPADERRDHFLNHLLAGVAGVAYAFYNNG